ncbi:MAG TPA: hypothetical protein VLL52_21715 [Anaerolineae bacterium]|nr:hypothetical protein [Anaerolineae bacterium]
MNLSPTFETETLTMGQLLDRSVKLYRQYFWQLVGLVAVIQLPLLLIRVLLSSFVFNELPAFQSFNLMPANYINEFDAARLGAEFSLATGLALIEFIFSQGIIPCIMVYIIGQAYLGVEPSVGEGIQYIRQNWLKIVLAVIFMGVGYTVLLVLSLIPCLGWFFLFGGWLFFQLVIMPLMWCTLVLEDQTITASLRRAWDLGRRRFWWLVGVSLLLSLFIMGAIGGTVGLLIFLLNSWAATEVGLNDLVRIRAVLNNIQVSIGFMLGMPLRVALIVVVYFYLRSIDEGIDIVWSLRAKEGQERLESDSDEMLGLDDRSLGLTTQLAQVAPTPATTSLFVSDDVMRFVGLSLVPFLMIAFFMIVYLAMVFLLMGAFMVSGGAPF